MTTRWTIWRWWLFVLIITVHESLKKKTFGHEFHQLFHCPKSLAGEATGDSTHLHKKIPSLKRSQQVRPWKWMVGRWSFPFGAKGLFAGAMLAVSFREGMCWNLAEQQRSHPAFNGPHKYSIILAGSIETLTVARSKIPKSPKNTG